MVDELHQYQRSRPSTGSLTVCQRQASTWSRCLSAQNQKHQQQTEIRSFKMTKSLFFSFKSQQADTWLRGGIQIEHVLTEGVEEALDNVIHTRLTFSLKLTHTHSFLQEQCVTGQMVSAEQAAQYADGALEQVHFNIFPKGQMCGHPLPGFRKLCEQDRI